MNLLIERTERRKGVRNGIDKKFPEAVTALTDFKVNPDSVSAAAGLTDVQREYIYDYLDTGSVVTVAEKHRVSRQSVSVVLKIGFSRVTEMLEGVGEFKDQLK